MEYFDNEDMVIGNPYAMQPAAQNVSMQDQPRHESGNALAANAEARAIAEVKAQVLMARQFPRDPSLAMDNILRECQRPTLADAAVYTFPRGKETVTGPSIRLAEVLARNWGNNTYGLEVLERKPGIGKTPGVSIVRAYAWDLETNTYIARQFELKHWRSTRSGGYALTDDRDIYELEANMGSRRMRACILQMIPGDITSMAVAACRQTAISGLSSAMKDAAQRQRIVTGTIKVYSRMGIQQTDLEDYLHAKVDDWNADHMQRLKELKMSIDDGVLTIGEVFPHLAGGDKNETISKDQVKVLMQAAKKTGRQGEISDAMKKLGIAKFADVPTGRYQEIKELVESFAAAKPDAIEDGTETQEPPQTEAPPEENQGQK